MSSSQSRQPRGASARTPVPVRVRVLDERGFERNVELAADLLRVGRDPQSHVRLDHPGVAPTHFLIIREGSHYFLMDTSAGIGTFLNGSPILKEELKHGDRISLGPRCPYRMVFLTEGTRVDDREEKRLRTLLDASKAINSSLVLGEVLERVMDSVMQLTQAEKGFLMLVEPNGRLKPRVARNIDAAALSQRVIPASRSAIREAITSRRTIFIGGETDAGLASPSASIMRLNLRTVMCVPLLSKDRVIGVIYVDHRSPVRHVSRTDLEILESLADHASVAIENARLTERMLLAERLSAVGQMVSSIVHDLRSPMTSIRAAAQLLQMEPQRPKGRRLTTMIMGEVDRMSAMTREVLDFCRGRTTVATSECRLSTFLAQLVDRIREDMAARSIELTLDVQADARLRLDVLRMERVLRNLFDNAADAMPQGGALRITATRDKGKVVISVSDTGRGMSEDVRLRIFEPFFTDGKPSGTGLGMAIALRIVEAHGGAIQIESAPGAGTTVRIILPVERGVQVDAPAQPEEARATAK